MARILDFRERFRLRKIIYAKPTIVIMVVLGFFIGRGAWGMYEKSIEAAQNRDKALEELSALQSRQAKLDADIAHLSSDQGMEEEIRDRFMVAKEGEKVMIVVAPKQEVTHSVTVPADDSPSLLHQVMSAVGLTGL